MHKLIIKHNIILRSVLVNARKTNSIAFFADNQQKIESRMEDIYALLPVPNQLKAQLQKCKTVRSADVGGQHFDSKTNSILLKILILNTDANLLCIALLFYLKK